MNIRPTILTGIRSNEDPTIGNYFGGMLPMIKMQKQHSTTHNINMFVPDLHSFTTPIDHRSLYQNTLNNLRIFVAAGLDLDDPNLFLYRQSFISAHSELTWILDCFTGFGEMSRMTQFKDKSSILDNDRVSVGLFNYPVLMAADILLYNAKWVPVGEDQFQHLEITRDIAQRMNRKFGDLFVIPASTSEQMNFINQNNGIRIRSLTEPTKKMSKSSDDSKSKILMLDDPESAYKKIVSATTDNLGVINFDWKKQPGISNLLQILALITDRDLSEVVSEWQGKTSYGEFKKVVANAIRNFLIGFRTRYEALSEDRLITKLETSEDALRPIANATLLRVQKAVGLRR
ncbi:MAG: tryptophan--tRNA ligase [Candidatus Saccharibacteria bacterium]|nr:tryptophan--tRNA ligase [Candidatus Saccharibacteria bacterium]